MLGWTWYVNIHKWMVSFININSLKCAGFSQGYRERPAAGWKIMEGQSKNDFRSRSEYVCSSTLHVSKLRWHRLFTVTQGHAGTDGQVFWSQMFSGECTLCDHGLGHTAGDAGNTVHSLLSTVRRWHLSSTIGWLGQLPQAWGHVVLQKASTAHSKTLAPSLNSENTQAFQIALISTKVPQLGFPNHVSYSFNFRLTCCFSILAPVIYHGDINIHGDNQSPNLSPSWPHNPQGSWSLPLLSLDSCYHKLHHYLWHPGFKHPFWPHQAVQATYSTTPTATSPFPLSIIFCFLLPSLFSRSHCLLLISSTFTSLPLTSYVILK